MGGFLFVFKTPNPPKRGALPYNRHQLSSARLLGTGTSPPEAGVAPGDDPAVPRQGREGEARRRDLHHIRLIHAGRTSRRFGVPFCKMGRFGSVPKPRKSKADSSSRERFRRPVLRVPLMGYVNPSLKVQKFGSRQPPASPRHHRAVGESDPRKGLLPGIWTPTAVFLASLKPRTEPFKEVRGLCDREFQ